MLFFLSRLAGHTSEKALFAALHQKYCTACSSSLKNFLREIMEAIIAGRTSFWTLKMRSNFYFQDDLLTIFCIIVYLVLSYDGCMFVSQEITMHVAALHQKYCTACSSSLKNFLREIMEAIIAGRTSFWTLKMRSNFYFRMIY